jgi:hypothetical protein
MANKSFGEVISEFGTAAKVKLSNPAITGAPEDQLLETTRSTLRA